MPTPFKCTGCSGTTMNSDWVCDDCKEIAYLEGDKKIYQYVKELEEQLKWYETSMKQILICCELRDNYGAIEDIAQSSLDGEPTTADEENVVYISDVNKEIAIDWKNRDREEKIKKECPIPVKGSRDGYWEPEIPKEQTWIGPGDPGDEHEELEKSYQEKKKITEEDEAKYRQSMITSIGYRGDD